MLEQDAEVRDMRRTALFHSCVPRCCSSSAFPRHYSRLYHTFIYAGMPMSRGYYEAYYPISQKVVLATRRFACNVHYNWFGLLTCIYLTHERRLVRDSGVWHSGCAIEFCRLRARHSAPLPTRGSTNDLTNRGVSLPSYRVTEESLFCISIGLNG